MKTTVVLERAPVFTKCEAGNIIVDCRFFVAADVIKATYDGSEFAIEDTLGDRKEANIHWKVDSAMWDQLVTAGWAPNYFGEFEVEVRRTTPSKFEDSEGKTRFTFNADLRPIKAHPGVPVGKTADNTVRLAKNLQKQVAAEQTPEEAVKR